MATLSKYQYHRHVQRLEHAIDYLRPSAQGDRMRGIPPNGEALAITTLAMAQVDMLKDRAIAKAEGRE